MATDTILNQKGRNDIATGSKTSSLAQVVNTFKDHGAREYTIVVLEIVNPPTTMQHYYTVNTLTFSQYYMIYECNDMANILPIFSL